MKEDDDLIIWDITAEQASNKRGNFFVLSPINEIEFFVEINKL